MRLTKLGGAAMLLSLAGCGDDGMPGGACTASFAMVGVTVVDGGGQPVPDASVTATLVRTGQVLVPTTLMLPVPGTYVLVDDGSSQLIRRSGDAVQARIAKGVTSVTADYVLAVEGGCHVSKVSGPDSVTLE
jgi:hypothetical protein